MKRPAVFFDRDNTLIVNEGYLGDPDGVVLVEGAAEVVAHVRRLGYAAVTFSNQSGVARGLFTEQDVHRVNSRLDEMLLDHQSGAVIDRHEFCPHHPDAVVPRYRQASEFRKPAPGMIYQAARQLGLDLGRSWVVGDAPSDIEAGRAAGCRTILFVHPTLPPSKASREQPAVEPDFVASNLREVADLIEKNPPPEVQPETQPAPAAEVDSAAPVAAVVSESEEGAREVTGEQGAGTGPIEAANAEPVASDDSEAEPVEGTVESTPSAKAAEAEPVVVTVGAHMDDRSTSGPGPSGDNGFEETPRRRSPPAVILAAKAAREAARNTLPDASDEALREAARSAARAAVMGSTQNHATPAMELAPPAEVEPTPESDAAPMPREHTAGPAEPPQYIEPAAPPEHTSGPEDSRTSSPAPSANLDRLEYIAEQVLVELRHRNDAGSEFSVSKLMAGITMVVSLALLVYAYLYKDNPTTLQNLLLLGLMLQTITISLLIMGRQK